ncbi:preprotein translocase subunit YajC [Pleionea mediterranea]|jgi:preprotein translocase subunit YajC|uniref:Sec translocon accessory complex subunit YajC n=1 Tax=Pleionea mediterranea TaxID=523701 RepID=A0A316FRY4_9GAMM|nr:preprotein translocase subunit YajC [Pleionea mediterranea]PWK50922.1 protein translocase subunit yajC [Pleionea mediterranea]
MLLAAQPGGSPVSFWIMMGLFVVIFYFLIIRPQSKRQKEHKKMIEAIDKGDEVSTAGGVLGKVNKVTDNYIIITIADDVNISVQKHAVNAVLPKGTLKSIKE